MTEHNYSGTTLDEQYRIISLIGKGGMGAVYLGQHVSTGAKVAVKFLHSSLLEREDSIKRFFREARAAAELSHENIIRVIDVGLSTFNEPYIVMEHLEGESLSDLLRRVKRADLGAARSIVEPVLLALGAIHAKGIVHRDIRPDKIYLIHRPQEKPIVKLIDFGLSKFLQSSAKTALTAVGTVIGDVAYISPEQARGDSNVNHLTDIYAVGMILYELLSGRLPFDSTRYHEVILAKLSDKLIKPQEAYHDFPMEAAPLVMSCLSLDPSGRPQNAMLLLKALRDLKQDGLRPDSLHQMSAGAVRSTIADADMGAGADEVPKPVAGGPKTDANLVSRLKVAWETGPKRVVMAVGGGVVVFVSLIFLFVGLSGGEETPNPEILPPPATRGAEALPTEQAVDEVNPPPAPRDVQIEVRGLPDNYKIYYDEAPVPMNPFRVDLKEVIVPLKVVAEGYETYITSVVPSEDQVVRVDMQLARGLSSDGIANNGNEDAPIHEGGSRRENRRPDLSARSRPSNNQKPRKSKKTKKRQSGKKSTKFMDEFE